MLISKRNKTHGNFNENASLSQSIKDVLKSGKNWSNLTDVQKESLEMIAMKMSRILSGDKDYRDHWDDIMGYAQLGGQYSPTNLSTVAMDIAEAANK